MERVKTAFIISLLTGKVLKWAETGNNLAPLHKLWRNLWITSGRCLVSPLVILPFGDQLYHLQQRKLSISEYALKFRTEWKIAAHHLLSMAHSSIPVAARCLWWHHGSWEIHPAFHTYSPSYARMRNSQSGSVTLCFLLPTRLTIFSRTRTHADRIHPFIPGWAQKTADPGIVYTAGFLGMFFPSAPSDLRALWWVLFMPVMFANHMCLVYLIQLPHSSILGQPGTSSLPPSAANSNSQTPNDRHFKAQTIIGKPLNRSNIRFRAWPLLLGVGVPHQKKISLLVLENSTADCG